MCKEAENRIELSHADGQGGRRMTGRALGESEAPFLCYRFAEERALAKQGGVQRGEARSRTV